MNDRDKPLQILVIDDDTVDRMAVRRFLKAAQVPFEFTGAESGKEGLSLLSQNKPDAIFLDYHMPGENGLEVLQAIRKRGIETPVIMLTGQRNEKIAVELMKAGASDYIPKDGMDAESLVRSLQQAIRLYEAEQEAKQAQISLQEYAVELEARNKELDAFASTVAHDLRGPLTTVLGFAKMFLLQYEDQLDTQGRRMIERIISGGEKGATTINSLLLLSRMRDEQVQTVALDMATIVAEALSQVEPMREGYNGRFQLPNQWPPAQGYPAWVEAVWVNYISNALKYGGRPPIVELGGTQIADGYIKFWVRDNGPGLSAEEQTHLFTPFTRLHVERAEGHGLGLSIVERIAHKLGGAAGVESQLGQGATFWFILPPA